MSLFFVFLLLVILFVPIFLMIIDPFLLIIEMIAYKEEIHSKEEKNKTRIKYDIRK